MQNYYTIRHMKTYELNYLVSGALSTEQAQDIALKVESLVQEQKGNLTEERKSKEIELGYEIDGSKKSVMFSIEFCVEPNNVIAIREQLKKMPDIMRFVVSIKKPVKISAKRQRKIQRRTEEKAVAAETKTLRKKPKVELKQIEKKLEEFLEE